MSDIGQAHKTLVERVLDSEGTAARIDRRAAFDNAGLSKLTGTLIDMVVCHANAVIDADIAVVRASGISEDQIFELVICAAIGQATRQYDTALAALDAALGKR
jgi:hypothetical protein